MFRERRWDGSNRALVYLIVYAALLGRRLASRHRGLRPRPLFARPRRRRRRRAPRCVGVVGGRALADQRPAGGADRLSERGCGPVHRRVLARDLSRLAPRDAVAGAGADAGDGGIPDPDRADAAEPRLADRDADRAAVLPARRPEPDPRLRRARACRRRVGADGVADPRRLQVNDAGGNVGAAIADAGNAMLLSCCVLLVVGLAVGAARSTDQHLGADGADRRAGPAGCSPPSLPSSGSSSRSA